MKLLYPSHVYRHKNFLLLARLMKRLSIPATLTLTAQASDLVAPATTVGELFGNARDRVRFIGDIDSRRMAAVYEAHDILIFPSLCEAFGLPLVEAMTMNMPIVASRLDWSIEICSEHAMYADPHDESDWAEKIAEVFRRGRRTNPGGVVRSQDFDWAQAASQYARLLLDR